MILTTRDGREFKLNTREYNEFLLRFRECELGEVPEVQHVTVYKFNNGKLTKQDEFTHINK